MKITCVVDDRAQPGSGLRAEHGASFCIEADGRRVLFDTGSSASVLLHNLAALGFSPGEIDALIISHGHDDHTGGLAGLLEHVEGIPLYAHPDLFRERFGKTDTGPRKLGPNVDQTVVADSVQLRLHSEPMEVVPGVWTSGEIRARPEPEGRSAYHIVRQGAGWTADTYRDDLSVVAEAEAGLVLICGCCHAGLLNTLACVREAFDQEPVAVVGGTHLKHTDVPTLEHVVDELRRYGPPQLWVGHCTGARSFLSLKAAFGDLVSLCQAGTVVQF
jgi:7,8-dihydropterin-6-yl-methyl-4-(beta-D-ribofuranosyl)aminobenzene 5'-phosphate synthase